MPFFEMFETKSDGDVLSVLQTKSGKVRIEIDEDVSSTQGDTVTVSYLTRGEAQRFAACIIEACND